MLTLDTWRRGFLSGVSSLTLCASQCSVGRDLGTVQLSCFSSYFLSSGVSPRGWFSPAAGITVVFARWRIPLSIFPSSVVNVNSSVERALLSPPFIYLFTYLHLFRFLAMYFTGCNSLQHSAAQIIPDLASGSPFVQVPLSF